MAGPHVHIDALRKNMPKLEINSPFSKEEVGLENAIQHIPRSRSRYIINPHPGFEVVELPYNNETAKLAYGHVYPENRSDLSIELNQIARWEGLVKQRRGEEKLQALNQLKFHYKRAISLISPKLSGGWNRWADYILDLWLSNKRNKVLWGSGGCSKSTIVGLLCYVWWRVNPSQRLLIVASRVKKEADHRVIAYVKEIHIDAPKDDDWNLQLLDSSDETGIFCMVPKTTSAKRTTWTKLDRAGIVSLPIKIEGATRELGGNLLGNHPDDALMIIFDECQELPGNLTEAKIFANWLTNPNVTVVASGNPKEVELHNPQSWDLLFRLGVGGDIDISTMKKREKEARKCGTWSSKNTVTLHLSMLDSPKDDPEEADSYVTNKFGVRTHRLAFLSGKENAERISETMPENCPTWYSQVLGFPFLIIDTQNDNAVLTPALVTVAREYPLRWRNRADNTWVMGVDPSLGSSDPMAIVCGEKGIMRDDRWGFDLHDGKYCRNFKKGEMNQIEFVDAAIEIIHSLSQELSIPLDKIEIELHGTGEVFRYALEKHLEQGKWPVEKLKGIRYAVMNPSRGPTERKLFKNVGKMEAAKDLVSNYQSELWLAVQNAVITRQIFNIPDYILNQGYRRNFLQPPSSQKRRLETKEELKARGIKSPNDFDALASAFNRARDTGFKIVFAQRNSYKDRYGEEYVTELERNTINKRLGMVSSLLGLAVDLGKENGGFDTRHTGRHRPTSRKLFQFRNV